MPRGFQEVKVPRLRDIGPGLASRYDVNNTTIVMEYFIGPSLHNNIVQCFYYATNIIKTLHHIVV